MGNSKRGFRKNNRMLGIHNSLISKLENQLLNSGEFEKIIKFYEYQENGVQGEIDLLGLKKDSTYFYEVKSNYTIKARTKAKLQFEKFKRAFPKTHAIGYLYCGGGLIQL